MDLGKYTCISKFNFDTIISIADVICPKWSNSLAFQANDSYLQMAIGNAPWPIGVTMVGIHARTGREKIFAQNVARILSTISLCHHCIGLLDKSNTAGELRSSCLLGPSGSLYPKPKSKPHPDFNPKNRPQEPLGPETQLGLLAEPQGLLFSSWMWWVKLTGSSL